MKDVLRTVYLSKISLAGGKKIMFCGGYNRTTCSRVIIRLDISCECLPYSANMTLTPAVLMIDSKRGGGGGGGGGEGGGGY